MESTIWSPISGGIAAPKGFEASGISAGLKISRSPDLALILAPSNSICAGTFTKSLARAECVNLCVQRLIRKKGIVRAVLINSGQANACTGNRGLKDSLLATQALSKRLGIDEDEVLICSTGVIGEAIPIQKLIAGIDQLVTSLDSSNGDAAAKAILTTDLIEKQIAVEAFLGGRNVRIGGMAKGSGMIHPDMATMLGFISCDALIPQDIWSKMIKRVVDSSFNSITVDGDTSTNDSFLAFASGSSLSSEYFNDLELGLSHVAQYLAKSIVKDGEGANCLMEVKVDGAKNNSDAQIIARTICSSSLVKTAIHGCDPNWGRIIAALGSSGISFSLSEVSLWIGSYQLIEEGLPLKFNRDLVIDYMRSKFYPKDLDNDVLIINLVIGQSHGTAIAWGCNLSEEYIRINADYTT